MEWMDVDIMKSMTSAATIEKLREIIARHRLPENIMSINGPNFFKLNLSISWQRMASNMLKFHRIIQLRMDKPRVQ